MPHVLTLNGGSSSLKFALFRTGGGEPPLTRLLSGSFERIGDAHDPAACLDPLAARVEAVVPFERLLAVGHRIVHGGPHYEAPERVTPAVLDELRRLAPFDPEHLPAEIALVEAVARRAPGLPQIACFDTAFHAGMPRVARLLPIPRRYEALGLRRYGFHGLSYQYLMRELERIGRPGEARGRVILAHLGNGVSMAAVHDGRPIDTTMALTPAAGLPMSRRSGDLDPGLPGWLWRAEGMTAERFNTMVHQESGLLGISETSSDVRTLMVSAAAGDVRAREALDHFCYEARKRIGAFAAVLGGLDTLVFAGGIGENAAGLRERICDGLGFLGVALDPARNAAGLEGRAEAVISPDGGTVVVRVMRTDEEMQIARAVVAQMAPLPAGGTT